MNKPIKWTLIGLGIFVGVVIVGFFGSAIVMGIIEAEKDIKEVSKAEEEIIVSEEKEKIIGYRDTKLRDKVPVVEWEIGEPIDFPNGLRLTLNKVWMEKQLDCPFVVISVTLENTTDEIQDGIDFKMPISSNVWDTEDNRFSGSCGLTNIEESIWGKIDSLSPGDNKKWPPGVKLTGNIYFEVSGNTGDLIVELEYFQFLKTNVIYCYKLEDIEE